MARKFAEPKAEAKPAPEDKKAPAPERKPKTPEDRQRDRYGDK